MTRYIMITATLPSHKFATAVEKFTDAVKKYPLEGDGGVTIAHVATRNQKGFKTIAIIQPPEGKLEELYAHSTERLMRFNDIEGYECTVEICTKIEIPFHM